MTTSSSSFAMPPARLHIDTATVLGLSAALCLAALPMAAGGAISSYMDGAALAFVLGGTFLLTIAAFPINETRQAVADIGRTLGHRRRSEAATVHLLVAIGEHARRYGPLKLQGEITGHLGREAFLKTGLGYVIDGMDPPQIEHLLQAERERIAMARMASVDVLRRAAELSPAMGLIGTLIGLIRMLGQLSNPEAIGPAMAIALLTTFYGAVLGNMILTPLAAKLDRLAVAEDRRYAIIATGLAAIARRDNPQRMEMLLAGSKTVMSDPDYTEASQ